MSALRIVWLLLPPLLLGSGLLATLGIRRRSAPLAWIGWSWALGALGTGAVLFSWSLLRLPWSSLGITGALLVPALLLHARAARRDAARPRSADETQQHVGRGWERALFAVVLVLVVGSALDRALLAWTKPVWTGDESQIWAAKAKLLWHSRGFSADFGASVRASLAVSHPEYPPLDPLLQLWSYVVAGEVDLFWSRLPLQASAVATLLVLADGLRRRARPLVAAPLLLLFAAVPGSPAGDLLPTVMADGLVALGLLVALDAWLRYAEGGDQAWLRLLGVGLALGTASKNEGLLYAALILVAVAVGLGAHGAPSLSFVRRLVQAGRSSRCAALAALLPWAATALLNARYGFRGDLTSDANAAGRPPWELLPEQLGQNLPAVLRFLIDEVLFSATHTRFLFLAALVLLVLAPRPAARGARTVPAAVLLAAAAALALVFVATPNELHWHLRTAGVRVYSQLLAATALWLGAALPCCLARGARTPAAIGSEGARQADLAARP